MVWRMRWDSLSSCRAVWGTGPFGTARVNTRVNPGVVAQRVSAIEHGELDRAEVATLRAYVEALGGRLRVVADFGDAEYTVA
ncbi:hypothetical protein RKD28_003580 [Streptomyces sp. SAI-229]